MAGLVAAAGTSNRLCSDCCCYWSGGGVFLLLLVDQIRILDHHDHDGNYGLCLHAVHAFDGRTFLRDTPAAKARHPWSDSCASDYR